MSSADELIEEMKSLSWSRQYDSETIKVDKVLPPIPERTKEHNQYIHDWIMKHIPKNSKRHLDVGCGEGWLLYRINDDDSVNALYGVDVSPEAIKRASKYVPSGEFKESYAEKIPYPDNYFDSVSCSQVIEHVKEPQLVLDELYRVCKPGGTVLVTTPIGKNHNGGGRSKHLHFFDFYDIMDLFDKYGDNYKVYWINKWKHYNPSDGVLTDKTCFAVRGVKSE